MDQIGLSLHNVEHILLNVYQTRQKMSVVEIMVYDEFNTIISYLTEN